MPILQTNEMVKRPHSKTDYSDQDLNDLANCIADPLFFMRTFMMVQHPIKGAIPFHPYECQERIINGIHEHRNTIVLASRQIGKTTCAAGYILWRAMFVPDTVVLVTANKYVQALEVMDRVRYAYENLPDHIRAGATEYNKGSVTFDNNSRIVARATSSDAGRGLAVSLLYCLGGDSFVKIRHKQTGLVENISLEDLYERLELEQSCNASDVGQ
jgi:hypothetical protein